MLFRSFRGCKATPISRMDEQEIVIGDAARVGASGKVDTQIIGEKRRQLPHAARQARSPGMPGWLRLRIEELRVVLAQHSSAGAGRHDHIGEGFECGNDLLGDLPGGLAVSGIVCRLPATGLGWRNDDAASSFFEQLHNREGRRWPEYIDETGDEKSNLNVTTFHIAILQASSRRLLKKPEILASSFDRLRMRLRQAQDEALTGSG